jgi:hypothetical protein
VSTPGGAREPNLERLVELVRTCGGLLAATVAADAPPAAAAGPAQLAAAGPRAARAPAEYELLVEAIYEGYLVHYGGARIVRTADIDLALLAGDRLYALGLARLVELGDIEAVAELADVIALCALAHAKGDGELADAVWEAGARAVGWGADEAHRRAKQAARDGDPRAAPLLRGHGGG